MDWQVVLTFVCVLLAAGYLARGTWRTWTAKGRSCGGCGTCATKTPAASTPARNLISTEMLTARLRERR